MTEQEANKLRKVFEESEIFQYYQKYGEGRASGYTKLRLYAKSPRGNRIISKTFTNSEVKRKRSVRQWLSTLTSEQRSNWSKNGWNNPDGFDERREHIRNQAEIHKEENKNRLSKYNQDSEHQAKVGSVGGKKGGPIVANRIHHCKYCKEDFKNLPYNRYHGEKCKKNPNRVIEYKYELVMSGKSYGKFEEKQGIAEYLGCSAALISRYMSGKKKDIKGYQIVQNGKWAK
jgi:hypothetical protein